MVIFTHIEEKKCEKYSVKKTINQTAMCGKQAQTHQIFFTLNFICLSLLDLKISFKIP